MTAQVFQEINQASREGLNSREVLQMRWETLEAAQAVVDDAERESRALKPDEIKRVGELRDLVARLELRLEYLRELNSPVGAIPVPGQTWA